MIAVIHEMSNLSACKLCAQRYVNIVCSCLTLSPSHLPFFSVDQKDKQTSSKCRIHRYLPTKKKRKQNKIRCWHEKLVMMTKSIKSLFGFSEKCGILGVFDTKLSLKILPATYSVFCMEMQFIIGKNEDFNTLVKTNVLIKLSI